MAFDDLYQEIILDHYRYPRNAAPLDHIPDSRAHENPTCGDSIKLELDWDGPDQLQAIRFHGEGCAISMASASMMSEQVTGLPLEAVKERVAAFIRIMRGEEDSALLDRWGDLVCLKGVIKYPLRVKCATLAWHALEDSLP